MLQDFAFNCNTYEEYCKMYDSYYGREEKKVEPIKMVTIKFSDGEVKDFRLSIFSISDLYELTNLRGAEIVRYYDTYPA